VLPGVHGHTCGGIEAGAAARCVFAIKRLFARPVDVIDMPYTDVRGVTVIKVGSTYLHFRVLLANAPPPEFVLGRRVKDRDRVVALLSTLSASGDD
jgi:hypothetical protein